MLQKISENLGTIIKLWKIYCLYKYLNKEHSWIPFADTVLNTLFLMILGIFSQFFISKMAFCVSFQTTPELTTPFSIGSLLLQDLF